MNVSSTILSMLLHVAVILAVWLWPTSPPLQLDKPMMQISLTMGAPGGDRLPSAVLGPQGKASPSQASNKPAPPAAAQQAAAAAASLPEKTRPEKLEAKAEARPESQKEVKPIPTETKPAPVPTPPKPAPKEPEAALVSPQRKPDEKKPEPKADPKPEPKPDKKADTKPAPAEKAQGDAKKAPSADDILRAALSEAKSKAGPASGGPAAPKKGSQSIAGALAAAERQVKQSGQGGGGGGEGSGPGGGGIYDVYAGMVILAIRPNWSMPTYSRDVLIAQVRVRLDAQGNVLSADIARSSGRADFDASAVNAVLRTKVLPAPPTPDQMDITIGFNSQEMMGR